MRRLLTAILCLALLQSAAAEAAGQARELIHAYPPAGPPEVGGTAPGSRMLRLLQHYAVQAFTDLLATHVAHTLRGASDPPVIVTRKVRWSGLEAAAAVASAAPDARTLLLTSRTPEHTAARLKTHAAADIDLQPVALVATMPFVIVVDAGSGLTPVSELIAGARRIQRRVLFASAGETSVSHLAIERLRLQHGRAIEPVSYNGGGAALQALATGEVDVALVPLPAVLAYARGGRFAVVAIADRRRHSSIPEVQTASEAGLPDFEAAAWFGVFAPGATPSALLREVDAKLARGAALEHAREVFSEFGLTLEHAPADAFARRVLMPSS